MTAVPQRRAERVWKFRCPECEFTDEEIGALATDDEVYCEVCMTESHRYVRLRRWFEAAEEPDATRR